MIEYAKEILPKVSSWKELFRKELIKCVAWAGPENRDEIYNWCCRHYADSHSDVLEEVFPDKKRYTPKQFNKKKQVQQYRFINY
jgi:hypothetical protein